ncbi:MAG: glucosamine-6-phosphate deaminase [Cytophagales bacterium]|jgi:galactosamine-6-phosphate isomerase|nr:glucosamine-6-phosphate deaminase [Cytophagales bacterium]
MQIFTYPDYDALSVAAAAKIAALVRQKPDAVLCVGSGDTPTGTYRRLVQLHQTGELDLSRCVFVGLDEWVGMDKTDTGSCQYALYNELFDPLGVPPERIHAFNAKAADLQAECRRIDAAIARLGGLDLMVVGVGMNGHIALNEPGTPFSLGCHVIDLDPVTVQVGQKYFTQATPLTQGITVGLRHLLEAREVLLLANGSRKAPVIAKAIQGPVTEQLPASVLQRHANAWVMLDEAAAAEL